MIQIFWGFLLLMCHIKVGGIDLLPDFIGYILLYIGLTELSNESLNFGKAKSLTIFMVIYSFIISIVAFVGFKYCYLLNYISVGLWLTITYLIILGIKDIEVNKKIVLYSNKMYNNWKLQLVINFLILISVHIIVLISTMLIIVASIVNLVFLYYLHKASREFSQN